MRTIVRERISLGQSGVAAKVASLAGERARVDNGCEWKRGRETSASAMG
ncbi:hypothetical protein CASFOL_002232 [Castilleja foliolosa]|uniref:Transposase n=1 Tax=Castilleja foliolosa TaxID=1961234 RepID=A0ABD3EDW0_9LAMI